MKALAPIVLLAALVAAGGCDRRPEHAGAAPPSGPAAANATAPADPSTPNATAVSPAAPKALGGALDDTIVTGKIKAAIAADAGMNDTDVSVSTVDGVVSLSGTVKSPEQVTIALNLAQRQKGVRRVDSAINVR